MSGKIDPEAAQPSTVQSFELSDRNPPVVNWGGTDAEGGQIEAPFAKEGAEEEKGGRRVTSREND